MTNYSAYVSTLVGLDFNYIIHDAWTMVGGLSYNTADYTVVPGSGAPSRTDTYLRGQIGLLYTLRPQVQIGPMFEYSSGSSTDPDQWSVLSAADLLCSTDRKALTMLPRKRAPC